MKIAAVEIHNFRALSDFSLSFCDTAGAVRPINVIVGPNGCGKTSILFAITQALRGVLGYRTTDVPEPNRDDIRAPLAQSGWSQTPPESRVSVTIQFDAVEQEVIPRILKVFNKNTPPSLPDGRVKIWWKYPPGFNSAGDRLQLSAADITPGLPYIRSWLFAKSLAIRAMNERRPGLSTEDLSKVGGFEFFPQDRNLWTRVVGENPVDAPYRAGSERVSTPYINPGDRDDDYAIDFEPPRGGRHDKPVSEILEQLGEYARTRPPLPEELDREKQIQKLFNKICYPKKYVGILYRDGVASPVLEDNNHRYPLSHAASGEQVVLEYITRLTRFGRLQRSVILIDEPEVHLHPKWIRQLYLALPQIGEGNQFIMTTHSDELRKRAAADNNLIELASLEGEQ